MTRIAHVALLLAAFVAACSPEPLIPQGDAAWSWTLGVSPESEAPAVARILKARLRAAGIKDLKVYPFPPRIEHTPGSRVASQVRIEVRNVATEAKPLVVHLVTTPGRLGVHRVDESSHMLDEVFDSLGSSDRNKVEAVRQPGLSTTLVSADGERLEEIVARAARQHDAPGRSLAIQPPNEPGKQPQFEAFVVHSEPELTNADIQSAKGLKDRDRTRGTHVQINLTPVGLETLSKASRENVRKRLAMVLDDTVINAPIIQEPIKTNPLIVTFGRGASSEDDYLMAQLWAFLISLEPAPAKLTLLEERAPEP